MLSSSPFAVFFVFQIPSSPLCLPNSSGEISCHFKSVLDTPLYCTTLTYTLCACMLKYCRFVHAHGIRNTICISWHALLLVAINPAVLASGPMSFIKVELRCRSCKLNYASSKWGNSSEGYEYYSTLNDTAKASDVVYIDSHVMDIYISLK